jgi:hypothetical protein
VIVFSIIGVLAHREKKQKKKEGQLELTSTPSDGPALSVEEGNTKALELGVQTVEVRNI